MITEIRKRDGRVEPFDASKIANAITKAMVSVDEVDGDVALRVTSKISNSNLSGVVDVEQIQDMLNTFGNIFTANIDDVSLPVRATSGSAGYDFVSPISFELVAGESIKVPTGIRVNIREGWWLAIVPRSSLGFKYRMQLDNTVGVVDSDYYHSDNEGHIFVKITNDSRDGKSLVVNAGDKFAQAIFLPYGITYDDAASGIRNGGFGSTNTPHVIEFGQAEKVG